MEAVNGVSEVDKGGPPAPSPLTGCYLLIVVGEPHSKEHKDIILRRIAKGLLSWDGNNCHVDLEKELAIITEQAPEGEDARYGERLIQFASENLVTEVLIHPAISTLSQCMKNLLSSFTRHRHVIHAGYTFAGNGSWILQDGTFSVIDFTEAFQEIEVQRVLRAYDNTISLDVHCSSEGEWNRLPKEPFTKNCKVRVNPDDVLTSGSPAIVNFLNYISPFLIPTDIEMLLESSDVVGNIRFSHPTLYVFPGGQGDAALFGINGFNMLVDGGFARKACFWDFVRHLDRLDAVLLTRLNNSNVNGISSVLRRKRHNTVYPQIGHFFCNIQERKAILSPDGDKDKDPLLVNLFEEGHDIMNNLRQLNLQPQSCYRDIEPINLYHKVGHGTLDMYILSPSRDSKEVREFLHKWNTNDQKLFATNQRNGKEFVFPTYNLVSICALLVWQPANTNDNITRILFPGSSPQNKIFEGLDKIKQLECIKFPSCSAKSLTPNILKTKLTKPEKIIQESKDMKLKQPIDSKPKMENKVVEENIKNGHTNGITNTQIISDKGIKKHDSTESDKSGPQSLEIKKTDSAQEIVNGKAPEEKIIEKTKPRPKPEQKLKPDVKASKNMRTVERKAKAPVEKKASPTTPKKTVETKMNGDVPSKARPPLKTSPSATPAKSAKEANNRKVVESKKAAPKKPAEKKETKLSERKPISRRPKGTSPIGKAPESPVRRISELHKVEARKPKLEKDCTTDSSTVSTPSADVDTAMKKDLSKLTPEELEQIKARELAELKEEQEVVKEIEAVFRKSETKPGDNSDMRKIKNISMEDKTEGEEYLIIEKEEIEHDSLDEKEAKESETTKHTRDSEESEKQRKLSDVIEGPDVKIDKQEAKQEEKPKEETVLQKEEKEVAKPLSKDISVTSPDDKIEELSGKKITDKEPEDDNKDINILESQPDEKYSTPIESGATTAPTLPEDERIPLDEIKEDNGDQVIEEKYVKEDTKEKEVPVVPLPPKTTDVNKIPNIVGIRLDRQTPMRDIVKTPDEVADLPVHEVVDIENYDQYQATQLQTPKQEDVVAKEKGELEQEKPDNDTIKKQEDEKHQSAEEKKEDEHAIKNKTDAVKVEDENITKEKELDKKIDAKVEETQIIPEKTEDIAEKEDVVTEKTNLLHEKVEIREEINVVKDEDQKPLEGKPIEMKEDIPCETKALDVEVTAEIHKNDNLALDKEGHLADSEKVKEQIEEKILEVKVESELTQDKPFAQEKIEEKVDEKITSDLKTAAEEHLLVCKTNDDEKVDDKVVLKVTQQDEHLPIATEMVEDKIDVKLVPEITAEVELEQDKVFLIGKEQIDEKVVLDTKADKKLQQHEDLQVEKEKTEEKVDEKLVSEIEVEIKTHLDEQIPIDDEKHLVEGVDNDAHISQFKSSEIEENKQEEQPVLEVKDHSTIVEKEDEVNEVEELLKKAESLLSKHDDDDTLDVKQISHKVEMEHTAVSVETHTFKKDFKEVAKETEDEKEKDTTEDLKLEKEDESYGVMENVQQAEKIKLTEAQEIIKGVKNDIDAMEKDVIDQIEDQEVEATVVEALHDAKEVIESIAEVVDEGIDETEAVEELLELTEKLQADIGDSKTKISLDEKPTEIQKDDIKPVEEIKKDVEVQPVPHDKVEDENKKDVHPQPRQEQTIEDISKDIKDAYSQDQKLEDVIIKDFKDEVIYDLKVDEKIQPVHDEKLENELKSDDKVEIEIQKDVKDDQFDKRSKTEEELSLKDQKQEEELLTKDQKNEEEHQTQQQILEEKQPTKEQKLEVEQPIKEQKLQVEEPTTEQIIEEELKKEHSTVVQVDKKLEDELKRDDEVEIEIQKEDQLGKRKETEEELKSKVKKLEEEHPTKDQKQEEEYPTKDQKLEEEYSTKELKLVEEQLTKEQKLEVEQSIKEQKPQEEEPTREQIIEEELNKEHSTVVQSEQREALVDTELDEKEVEVDVHKAVDSTRIEEFLGGDNSSMRAFREDSLEISKIDKKLQELKESAGSDSPPQTKTEAKLELDILDKLELGRKSPKEREQDVAKIVASVAEVLKSDAPLEEFEGKIPLGDLNNFTPYTTELRETHITTLESPIKDVVIESTVMDPIEEEKILDPTSMFINEERKISDVHTDYDSLTKEGDNRVSSLLKDSKELMQATSKMLSDIKQSTVTEEFAKEETTAVSDDSKEYKVDLEGALGKSIDLVKDIVSVVEYFPDTVEAKTVDIPKDRTIEEIVTDVQQVASVLPTEDKVDKHQAVPDLGSSHHIHEIESTQLEMDTKKTDVEDLKAVSKTVKTEDVDTVPTKSPILSGKTTPDIKAKELESETPTSKLESVADSQTAEEHTVKEIRTDKELVGTEKASTEIIKEKDIKEATTKFLESEVLHKPILGTEQTKQTTTDKAHSEPVTQIEESIRDAKHKDHTEVDAPVERKDSVIHVDLRDDTVAIAKDKSPTRSRTESPIPSDLDDKESLTVKPEPSVPIKEIKVSESKSLPAESTPDLTRKLSVSTEKEIVSPYTSGKASPEPIELHTQTETIKTSKEVRKTSKDAEEDHTHLEKDLEKLSVDKHMPKDAEEKHDESTTLDAHAPSSISKPDIEKDNNLISDLIEKVTEHVLEKDVFLDKSTIETKEKEQSSEQVEPLLIEIEMESIAVADQLSSQIVDIKDELTQSRPIEQESTKEDDIILEEAIIHQPLDLSRTQQDPLKATAEFHKDDKSAHDEKMPSESEKQITEEITHIDTKLEEKSSDVVTEMHLEGFRKTLEKSHVDEKHILGPDRKETTTIIKESETLSSEKLSSELAIDKQSSGTSIPDLKNKSHDSSGKVTPELVLEDADKHSVISKEDPVQSISSAEKVSFTVVTSTSPVPSDQFTSVVHKPEDVSADEKAIEAISGRSSPEITEITKDLLDTNKSPIISRKSTPEIIIDNEFVVLDRLSPDNDIIETEQKSSVTDTKDKKEENLEHISQSTIEPTKSSVEDKVEEKQSVEVLEKTSSDITTTDEPSSILSLADKSSIVQPKDTEVTDRKEEIVSTAGPSGITETETIRTEEVDISRKSTPDIADVVRASEKEDLSLGRKTPPTAPVSPIVKDKFSSSHDKQIKDDFPIARIADLRSSTPASDDCDISSGQVSRVLTTEDDDEKQVYSDDEDIPGSPLSAASQIAHSISSQYDFEDSVRGTAVMDPMSTSFYGALPDDPIDLGKELKEEKLSAHSSPSHIYEITTAKYSSLPLQAQDDESFRSFLPQTDIMSASFIGSELPSETKDDPIASWGKPLGLPSPAPINDNKGTPKKERKIPSNVVAKNKLNEDKKNSDSKFDKKGKKINPVYVDLTYVPHNGNSNYSYVDFFKRIRARYYVFSGIEPSKEVYNALLEAKQTWDDKDLEVTIIPTYDTDVLGYWVAENEDLLAKHKIDLSPSASRCTINLQDHETSCSAYRLEFS